METQKKQNQQTGNLSDEIEFSETTYSNTPSNLANSTHGKNDEVQKPVTQETKTLDVMAKTTEETEKFYRDQVEKNWTLIEKVKERSLYKQVQQVKKDLFKTSSEYRLAFYKTAMDTRLEAFREKCDAGLKMIKGECRHQVASFLMAKTELLTQEVHDRQVNFLEMMKRKYRYAESLNTFPSMKEHYMKIIFDEEGRHLKFLDSQISKFENIADEEIKKYM